MKNLSYGRCNPHVVDSVIRFYPRDAIYASAVLAMSLCLFVISRSSIETG